MTEDDGQEMTVVSKEIDYRQISPYGKVRKISSSSGTSNRSAVLMHLSQKSITSMDPPDCANNIENLEPTE